MSFALPQVDTSWSPVRMLQGPKRPNLVLIRTGNGPLHKQWPRAMNEPDRNWDLMLSHYGSAEPEDADADIIVKQGALKFPAIGRLFRDIPWLLQYQAVWMPDDDILTSWADVNRMFALFRLFDLDLAQPALTANSYASHRICYQRPDMLLRFTNFVEIMAPLFSARGMQLCLPTLERAVSGWGLDWIWPKLVGMPHKTAIIDAVAVQHTRPAGAGPIYEDFKKVSLKPHDEMHAALQAYGVTSRMQFEYGGISAQAKPASNAAIPAEPGMLRQLGGRLEPLLAAVMKTPRPQSWQSMPTIWKSPENWQGGPAAIHGIPALGTEDWAMSLGFALRIDRVNPGQSAAVIEVGDAPDRARLIIASEPVKTDGTRLAIRLFGESGAPMILVTPDLPLGRSINVTLQVFPLAGWVRLWLDGRASDDMWMPPWQWRAADQIRLGDPALAGTIGDAWLSPLPVESGDGKVSAAVA